MEVSHLSAPSRILDFPAAHGQADLSLSVVIPVYNGATTIGSLLQGLFEANPGYRLQVVLVNDASQDGSREACELLVRRHPNKVTFVDLARNVGEHNAVMAGLAHARGAYCIVMDDDHQNPPEEVYRLVETAVRERRDVVFSIYEQKKHHWFRNLGSSGANAMIRRLMDLPPDLYLSSFKCLSRFAVEQVLSYRGPFPYVDGLVLRATNNIGVVKTQHAPSLDGTSRYTAGKLLSLLSAMLVNFSILPLRIATFIGLLLSTLGVLGTIYVIWERTHQPTMPVGWSSLIIAILFLSGTQLLILGIFGEYLGQLYLTVNGTPQYVVRSVSGEGEEPDGE